MKPRLRVIRPQTASPGPSSAAKKPFSWAVWPWVVLGGVLVAAGLWWAATQGNSNRDGMRPTSADASPARSGPEQSLPISATASNGSPIDTAGASSEAARHYLNEGSDLLRQDKTKEAVEQFRLALTRNPADEDVHYNLAIALAKLGQTDEAIQEYRETLRLMPDYVEAHNNLGNLLTKKGQYDEAIQHFNAALATMPENASAHNNLGTALGRQGKAQEAIAQFAEAVRLQTNYFEAHFNLGNACLMAGQTARAVIEFNEVLRMRPDFAPALQGLEKARRLPLPGPLRMEP
jgi:tetratricopeptide (TPR) repeat protein